MNKLIIGVTGTRDGMSKLQKESFESCIGAILFQQEWSERILHQGQCIGVDVEFARLLKNRYGFKVISHPPIKKDLIGICENDEVCPAKSYFARNRDIVNCSELMFVFPKEERRQSHGGTWYTFDFAIKNMKPTILIRPSGKIDTWHLPEA